MRGKLRVSLSVLTLVGFAVLLAGIFVEARQVPIQDQQPAGSALRPAVMGPSGGVSTGHLLTTAAAFGILLDGGNAFDAGVTALLAAGCSNRIFTVSGARRWSWFTPPAKTKSLQSSARVGRLAPWTWIGTSRETRLSRGKDSIRLSFRALFTPPSRCWSVGER